MSLICGCSSTGGGGATIVPGAKPFYRYDLPSRLPLFLTSAWNETAFPCKSSHKASALVVRPIRASSMDSFEKPSDFAKRMELAWVITQQPRPVACSSCASKGHVECKWCGGTGFFVIGNNLLCEFPSRNTSCLICAAKGSVCCADCKGTGFRAKWLGKPPPR